jgi:DNA recombination protein RmuC
MDIIGYDNLINSTMPSTIIGVAVGLIIGGLGVYLLLRSRNNKEEISETISQKLTEIMPSVLDQANESLIRMANEKLSGESKQNRVDMENKRQEIERMVKEMQKYLETSDKERIGTFSALKTSLEEYKKITEQLSVSTEGLKKALSNNQVRGQFGEEVADELLKMAGFVRGVDYEFNKEQAGSETRPDFAVFMPDGTRINVDSKFPYSNLQKMSESESKEQKAEYHKLFVQDVKDKIKQVTNRDYINPEDKTVDFVILFIPNEMIFSYIYDKMPDVWKDAMANKVILAGPFTFTAILRMVKQSYDNFKIQKNIYEVIQHVKSFEKEWVKFSDEFEKVGGKILAAQKQYEEVEGTRYRQLQRSIDKVKLEGEDLDAGEQTKLLE